jgi:hypothetical protein
MTHVRHVPAVGSMAPSAAVGDDGAAARAVTAMSTTIGVSRARMAGSVVRARAADKIQ